MQAICDIFLLQPVAGTFPLLRQLKIFQSGFTVEDGKEYMGFLGLDIPRIKAVAVVTYFRQREVAALNVPVRYRDSRRLTLDEAKAISGYSRIASVGGREATHPMYYTFQRDALPDEEVAEGGGKAVIDALDGHSWTQEEQEEYDYDFNNLL